jgi:hypothetical protein
VRLAADVQRHCTGISRRAIGVACPSPAAARSASSHDFLGPRNLKDGSHLNKGWCVFSGLPKECFAESFPTGTVGRATFQIGLALRKSSASRFGGCCREMRSILAMPKVDLERCHRHLAGT